MAIAAAKTALIVGVGSGLSASVARRLAAAGVKVGLAARNTDKLAGLVAETGGAAFRCDVSVPAEVERLFVAASERHGPPDIVIFNASGRVRGPIAELDAAEVERALLTTAFGGFLVGREAAKAMAPRGSGVIIFTGASASMKGFAGSAPFAMGKFALRGLAQSMARELGPKGVHVAHVIIDGGILSPGNANPHDQPESRLDPEAIADAYLHLIAQSRSAWTQELDLRPWSERF
jgi:NAD(P)-dependent dehydrogenase (short-subunit alcohol dehydrogenase family)